MKRICWLAGCLAAVLIGCGGNEQSQAVPTIEQTGIAVEIDLFGQGASGAYFSVTRVECDEGVPFEPYQVEATEWIEDQTLPGGIPLFENDPLDAQSIHLFADHYFVLPAGCYDVNVEALDGQGRVTEDCAPAFKNNVTVVDGKTTEILLISQCRGPEMGGLDVIVAFNHPPTIVDVDFRPSKFVKRCEPITVCVTAKDPDNDPLEFVWGLGENEAEGFGNEPSDGPYLWPPVSNEDGSVTQCATYFFNEAGSLNVLVSVYDLLWDEGTRYRIEDWLALQGYPNDSHDSLEFPIHVGSEEATDLPPLSSWVVLQDASILSSASAVENNVPVATFYRYGTPDAQSYNAQHHYANGPVPVAERSMIFLSKDTNTDEVSLVHVHDHARRNNGTFPTMSWFYEGLGENFFVSVKDDPTNTYTSNLPAGTLQTSHHWVPTTTDGVAISGLPWDGCVIATNLVKDDGINALAFIPGDGSPLTLDLAKPTMICPLQCNPPREVLPQ